MNENPFSFGADHSADDVRTQVAKLDMATALLPHYKVDLNHVSTNDLCNQKKLGICTFCSVRMNCENHFKDGVRLSEYWGYLMDCILVKKSFIEGSSIMNAMKVANKYGVPSKAMEAKYPLKTDGTYADFINHFIATYFGIIASEIMADAANHKIPGYYSIPVTPEAIAAELQKNKIISARFTVGENTYTAADGRISWAPEDLFLLRAPKIPEGGHAWCINEHDGLDLEQVGTGPNSWSMAWGLNGYFKFKYSTQMPYFTEAWGISDFPLAIPFLKDLKLGMIDSDVRRLQIFLNANNAPISDVGPGSPGQETSFFGQKTKSALIKFQAVHGIPATGFCGPMTRKIINQMQGN